MKAREIIIIAVPGIISVIVAGRLAYTENARHAMTDYNDLEKKTLADPLLIATWRNKLSQASEKHEDQTKSVADCEFNEQEKEEYINSLGYIPRSASVNVVSHCYRRMQVSKELFANLSEQEIDRLGTYEQWAIDQSSKLRNHIWHEYPKGLRKRIEQGERGLMLGLLYDSIHNAIF